MMTSVPRYLCDSFLQWDQSILPTACIVSCWIWTKITIGTIKIKRCNKKQLKHKQLIKCSVNINNKRNNTNETKQQTTIELHYVKCSLNNARWWKHLLSGSSLSPIPTERLHTFKKCCHHYNFLSSMANSYWSHNLLVHNICINVH